MLRPALLSALLLAACANGGPQPFVPDTARLVPGELGYGIADPDVSSINLAAWAFADPGRTRNNPAEAARACASMDYIAGEVYTSPRWAEIDALSKEQLLHGRVEMRRALGIPLNAPSQLVVNGLAGAGNALAFGNSQAALAALSNPAFPNPQATLARLSSLPYMQQANVGSLNTANEIFGHGQFFRD